jgi:hypothetical protein
MPADNRCLNCGAQQPATAPAGLCPQRLLRLGPGADLWNGRGPTRTTGRPAAVALDVLTSTVGALPRVDLCDTEAADRGEPLEKPNSPELHDPVSAALSDIIHERERLACPHACSSIDHPNRYPSLFETERRRERGAASFGFTGVCRARPLRAWVRRHRSAQLNSDGELRPPAGALSVTIFFTRTSISAVITPATIPQRWPSQETCEPNRGIIPLKRALP